MKVARKWSIYFWRIGIFTMILSACSLSVFTLDKSEDLADRYNMLLTLLLAAVAFQYIINAELPKLPYLTLMDIYVLFSFSFVFLVIICVSVSGFFEVLHVPMVGSFSLDDADQAFFYVMAGVFVVFHIWFVVKAWLARRHEMKKINMTRWDYSRLGYEKEDAEVISLYNKDIRMDDDAKDLILERSWWTSQDVKEWNAFQETGKKGGND